MNEVDKLNAQIAELMAKRDSESQKGKANVLAKMKVDVKLYGFKTADFKGLFPTQRKRTDKKFLLQHDLLLLKFSAQSKINSWQQYYKYKFMIKKFTFFSVIAALLLTTACASGPATPSVPNVPTDPSNALKFNTELKTYNNSSFLSNELFSPVENSATENGPAIVMLPSCGGITPRNNISLRYWIGYFTERGFTVLMVDHYNQRGVGGNCGGSKLRTVSEEQLVKDVYEAVLHLSKVPGVDKNRIFTLGWSLGAMAGSLAASQSQYERHAVANTLRPRAVAGMYGGCQYGPNGIYKFVYPDTNLPLLWLTGSSDTESPPSDCYMVKSLPNAQMHVYPKATHCWDCSGLDGLEKIGPNGKSVVYIFNKDITEDSGKRVFNFFNSFK